jgi:hypothetical protein
MVQVLFLIGMIPVCIYGIYDIFKQLNNISNDKN